MEFFPFLFLFLKDFYKGFQLYFMFVFHWEVGRQSKLSKCFSENQVYGITCPGVYMQKSFDANSTRHIAETHLPRTSLSEADASPPNVIDGAAGSFLEQDPVTV